MLAGLAAARTIYSYSWGCRAKQSTVGKTLSSQVYNLPETVRESDVEKLSFAVQLAEGFYAASQVQ